MLFKLCGGSNTIPKTILKLHKIQMKVNFTELYFTDQLYSYRLTVTVISITMHQNMSEQVKRMSEEFTTS